MDIQTRKYEAFRPDDGEPITLKEIIIELIKADSRTVREISWEARVCDQTARDLMKGASMMRTSTATKILDSLSPDLLSQWGGAALAIVAPGNPTPQETLIDRVTDVRATDDKGPITLSAILVELIKLDERSTWRISSAAGVQPAVVYGVMKGGSTGIATASKLLDVISPAILPSLAEAALAIIEPEQQPRKKTFSERVREASDWVRGSRELF